MKLDSAYKRAMDAVRPTSARREAMLQTILNHRSKPVARRWALAAVPAAAVAVLALALAWGGGAFAPGRIAAPDVVTRAATSTPTPSLLPTLKPGTAQWLPNVTLASPGVAGNLPEKLVLVRSELVELSEGEINDAVAALETLGWNDVKLERASEGYYRLSASSDGAEVDAGRAYQLVSVFLSIADKRGVRFVGDRPKAYSGLRLSTMPESGDFVASSTMDQAKITAFLAAAFWRDQQLGGVNALPPEQALKNAFYVQNGHPALDAEAALQVSTLNFVCVSGVPCYQFPVETASGTRYGYALAVDQKDLDAVPELAATYRRFLNGETMQIDVILDSSVDHLVPVQPVELEQSLPLTNLKLTDGTNQPDGLPGTLPLLRTTPIELTDEQLQAVAQRLRDKGWKDISAQKQGDGSYLIRTEGNTSGQAALSDTENRKQARQFMQDSGLAELLRQQGMPVSLQSADGSGSALYRGLDHGYATPGFVRLNLEQGKTVGECLIYAVRSQLLYEMPRLTLEQAAKQAFYFPKEKDLVQPDTVLEASTVRLVYADMLPLYEITAPIPGTRGMVTAYALAVDEALLQPNEELSRALERFRFGQLSITGSVETSQRLPYLKVELPEGERIVELDDEIYAHMESLFRKNWKTVTTAKQASLKYTASEKFYTDTTVWVFWQRLEDEYGTSEHGYLMMRNDRGERALGYDTQSRSPIATELCNYLLGVVNGMNIGFSYVDRSDIRDITSARLTMKDGRTVELTDKSKLSQLEKRIREAQPVGYRPQTYAEAARMELTLAKGTSITVMLDGLNDFFWLGSGRFFDYGPDPSGRDPLDPTTPNDTSDLLALFGLQGWE